MPLPGSQVVRDTVAQDAAVDTVPGNPGREDEVGLAGFFWWRDPHERGGIRGTRQVEAAVTHPHPRLLQPEVAFAGVPRGHGQSPHTLCHPLIRPQLPEGVSSAGFCFADSHAARTSSIPTVVPGLGPDLAQTSSSVQSSSWSAPWMTGQNVGSISRPARTSSPAGKRRKDVNAVAVLQRRQRVGGC